MQQYISLLRDILEHGTDKGDRTGTGTRSVFGRQLRFDLAAGIPIVSTKKVHIKSVIHELLWFLSGDTNTKYLVDNGVRIWNEWADEEGNLGPVYGAQWRNWDDGKGGTVDQVATVIEQLKKTPNSRRIIINGWNVAQLPDESISPQENIKLGNMALPPCHMSYQFYVANNKLSCQLYQRSADVFLGSPFNILSASILLSMIAQQCDLELGELIYTLGDAHLYQNHINEDIVFKQLEREPKPLPKLKINRKPSNIFDYRFEDFEIVGYDPHPTIKAPISI